MIFSINLRNHHKSITSRLFKTFILLFNFIMCNEDQEDKSEASYFSIKNFNFATVACMIFGLILCVLVCWWIFSIRSKLKAIDLSLFNNVDSSRDVHFVTIVPNNSKNSSVPSKISKSVSFNINKPKRISKNRYLIKKKPLSTLSQYSSTDKFGNNNENKRSNDAKTLLRGAADLIVEKLLERF